MEAEPKQVLGLIFGGIAQITLNLVSQWLYGRIRGWIINWRIRRL